MSTTTKDRDAFLTLVRMALTDRVGDTGSLDLAYAGNDRAPTLHADLATEPEHPEAAIHQAHVDVPLDEVPGPDPEFDEDNPQPEGWQSRQQIAEAVADSLASAIASAEWLPVDADPDAGAKAAAEAEAEQQAQDEARHIADERAQADAAKAAER